MYSKIALTALLAGILVVCPCDAFLGSLFGKKSATDSKSNGLPLTTDESPRSDVVRLSNNPSEIVRTAAEIAAGSATTQSSESIPSDDALPPRVPANAPLSDQLTRDAVRSDVASHHPGEAAPSGGAVRSVSHEEHSDVSMSADHALESKTGLTDDERSKVLHKEMEELGKPLGPAQSGAGEALRPDNGDGDIAFEHVSLKSRVKDAMQSLSTLYDALHKARELSLKQETPEGSETRLSGPLKSSDGQPEISAEGINNPIHEENLPASPTEAPLEGRVTHALTVSLVPPTVQSQDEAKLDETAKSAVQDPTKIQAHERMATWSGPNRGGSVVANSLSALAGVMFVVAAVGLMIAGFAQSYRGNAATVPLYPPRGPAFV
jgi:hypothetical protein